MILKYIIKQFVLVHLFVQDCWYFAITAPEGLNMCCTSLIHVQFHLLIRRSCYSGVSDIIGRYGKELIFSLIFHVQCKSLLK